MRRMRNKWERNQAEPSHEYRYVSENNYSKIDSAGTTKIAEDVMAAMTNA